jgi:RNA polymerase sigma factor (sigma-70 family)
MPSDSERTDGALLAAVVAGDGAAFATFYRRHLPAVVGFLLRETGDRETTADLAAEVFAAVFLVARRFRPRDVGSARPWVLGIARNQLLESRRRGRVEDRARRRLAFEPEVLDDDDLARVDELAAGPGHAALELVESGSLAPASASSSKRRTPERASGRGSLRSPRPAGSSSTTGKPTRSRHWARPSRAGCRPRM